jgi:outer membrane receptor protein involved in Fe transport
VGGNAEYQIVPRLSVFVQLNNLLNNKYQRWQYYEAYGLNIYGGLRLKF